MRRRLDLAASLVGRPAILYLDEPTTGLDPHSRNEVWAIIRRLVADGSTVLLTTQYLEEADALADSIVVFDHGRIVASGTSAELKAQTGRQSLDVRPTAAADLDRVAKILEQVTGAQPSTDPDSRARVRQRHRRLLDADGGPPARRGRDRRHRTVLAAADPGRGLPRPHRSRRRRNRRERRQS